MAGGRMAGGRLGPGGVMAATRRPGLGSSSADGLIPTSWPTGRRTGGRMTAGAVTARTSRAGRRGSSAGGPMLTSRPMARGPMAGGRPSHGAVTVPLSRAGLDAAGVAGLRPMSRRTARTPVAVGRPGRGRLAAAIRLMTPGNSGRGDRRSRTRHSAAALAAWTRGPAPRSGSARTAGSMSRPPAAERTGPRPGRWRLPRRARGSAAAPSGEVSLTTRAATTPAAGLTGRPPARSPSRFSRRPVSPPSPLAGTRSWPSSRCAPSATPRRRRPAATRPGTRPPPAGCPMLAADPALAAVLARPMALARPRAPAHPWVPVRL
jgi:hypothetical protein